MPLAKPTKPDAITAVPTPVPLRTDRANFAVRGDAMMGWFPTGIAGVNTTLTYFGNAVNFVEQEANEAEASATAAAAANVGAGVNAAAAAASAGAVVWVTGTTYAAGVVRYSPTNYQTYRDTAGGVSNTDPASDTTGRWISAMLPSAEAIGLPAMPPTAVFNFASGVIDRRFVESRSTAGTRYNKFGNLETLAAGVAKPTYDPATNECDGYLASPATTYLAMQSAAMDGGGWSKTNCTVTAASAVGIDGAMSLFKVEAALTAGTTLNRSVACTATSQYVTIRAAKGSGATDCNTYRFVNGTTAAELCRFTINYDTGVITHSSGSGATATDVGHGGIWEIRVPLLSGISVGNTLVCYLGFIDLSETAGEFAYISHVDVADQPNAPHEPTAGSNVTTVAGGLTLDLTAHDDIVNPQGFTVVCAFEAHAVQAASRFAFALNEGVSSAYTGVYSFNGALFAEVVVGSSSQAQAALGTYTAGRCVVAMSVQAGELLAVRRGGAVVSAVLASMPGYSALGVGSVAGLPGQEPGTATEILLTFPRACTAGELTALVNNI